MNATQQYDAFGNLASSTGTWQGQFGYGGGFGYQQDSTGLKLLGHRYYDSSTGRFLTRDPIKDGRNWYVYCDSDPLSRFDPTGLFHSLIAKKIFDLTMEQMDSNGFLYNVAVGAGDGVSFGLTSYLRELMGTNTQVDTANVAYQGGYAGGVVLGIYVGGAQAGASWSAARGGMGGALRLGGRGTRNSHFIRVESGPVHLIPGWRSSAVPHVLHMHINVEKLRSLHLPYQLWPYAVAAKAILDLFL